MLVALRFQSEPNMYNIDVFSNVSHSEEKLMKTRKFFKDFQRTHFVPIENLRKRGIFCTINSSFGLF